MKKAIFTIAIGDDPSFQYSIEAMRTYAKKIGAELIVAREKRYPYIPFEKPNMGKSAYIEKLYVKTLLQDYDRVLYLDADILVTPHAPDIFAAYPREDTVYMFNEGLYEDRSQAIKKITTILPYKEPWPTEQGKHIYYNAGVILCSQQSNLFAYASVDMLLKVVTVPFCDQTYFNYLINKHNLRAEAIHHTYNLMDIFDNAERRFGANFIHYAGNGYCKKPKHKYRVIIKDFCRLYQSKLTLLDKIKNNYCFPIKRYLTKRFIWSRVAKHKNRYFLD